MKIVFVGSSEFALPALRTLVHQAKHPLVAVITQPDNKKGRGLKDSVLPVKAEALKYGVPAIWQSESINTPESIAKIRDVNPDLMIVVSYGQKISDAVLNIPAKGCINIHPSLLPKYRGSAPINYALLNGDKQTGITIFKIVNKMDAGPILKQVAVDISDNETAIELSNRLAEKSAEILMLLLDEIDQNSIKLMTQDESLVTLAPKFDKSDGEINWSKSSQQILNQIRAMCPWPGTYTYLSYPPESKKEALKVDICRAVIYTNDAKNNPAPGGHFIPMKGLTVSSEGEIIEIDGNRIIVACGNNEKLMITKLKPAGGRVLSAKEFINGYRLKIGNKFGR
jgi:methionyl-tRNA formyltransferase